MNHSEIAQKIIDLKNNDLELRESLKQNGLLGEGYNDEMAKLHDKNAMILENIIDMIGYPVADKVGKEANEAAWLVIQHSIGRPKFMRKCARLLENEVKNKNADPQHFAYLSDRIAVLEGKPQLYGTQFDWDSSGLLNPDRFDDVSKVNERRKSIGLNNVQDQTLVIRDQAKNENQLPPADYQKRQKEIYEWKKSVGWL